MKVLFFSPFVLNTHHFMTEIELATKHKLNKDDVYFLLCESSLPFCEKNTEHKINSCLKCLANQYYFLDCIGIQDKNRININLDRFINNDLDIPNFNNLKSLKDFEIEGVDFGFATASSLISLLRESKPDMIKNKTFIQKILRTSISIYKALEYYIEKINPDIIYLFNGRFATVRPALRLAEKKKIDIYIHENLSSPKKYIISKNNLPHSIEYLKNELNNFWLDKNSFLEKKKISLNWFQNNKNFKRKSVNNFLLLQKKNKLPSIDLKKRNIVIYCSSEDEYESIDKKRSERFFHNQEEAIIKILNNFINENHFHFYIRMHPNLSNIENSQTKGIYSIELENTTIIKAEEDIDSYSLLELCEKVVTFGSTIGIEACFLEKPSILLGRAIYEDLNVCYKPKSFEETFELINSKLGTLSTEGCFKYGYWVSERSILYEYYKPVVYESGLIEAVPFALNNNIKRKYDRNHLIKLCNSYLDKLNFKNINDSFKKITFILFIDETSLISNDTLSSILEQSYQNFEVLIVSKSNKSFDNKKVITIKNDRLENYINSSDSNYYMILDNDITLFYNSISHLLNLFNDKLDYVVGSYLLDNNLSFEFKYSKSNTVEYNKIFFAPNNIIFEKNIIPNINTMIFGKDIFKKLSIFSNISAISILGKMKECNATFELSDIPVFIN